MARLLNPLRFPSWPTWVKMTVGFTLAMSIPIVVLLSVNRSAVTDVGFQSTRFYLQEMGTLQRQNLEHGVARLFGQLVGFAGSPDAEESILAALNTESPAGAANAQAAAELFNSALLNIEDRLYENIWLLNTSGEVMAFASAAELGTDAATLLDQDIQRAALTADNFAVQQRHTDLVVYTRNNRPVMQVIIALDDSAGETIGYLVGLADLNKTLFPFLARSSTTIPVQSYLVDRRSNTIIAPEDIPARGLATAVSPAVQRGLSGVRGIDVYEVGTDNKKEVLGYYAPIVIEEQIEPRLVLVTQIDRAEIDQPIFNYLRQASFPVLAMLAAVGLVFIVAFSWMFVAPISQLIRAMRAMVSGDYEVPILAVRRGDEVGRLARVFVDTRQQVRSLISELSLQMAERVRDVETTQEISRFASAQRDLQTLMNQVVELIVARFANIYHAQIFLVDQAQNYALLRASTGQAGQQLLARGHRLAVGSISVIGQVTQEGRIVIARDIATSEVHRQNEFLPETRAELAIPLRIGETILGALDVQSKQGDSFTDEQVRVLEVMADQIAIAIQNVQLYQESLRQLQEIEASNRAATRRAWEAYMATLRVQEISAVVGTPTTTDMQELRNMALARGQTIIGEPTERSTIPLVVPIQLRGQTLGAVEWELAAADFNANKVLLAQELVNRLSVNLDNARLFQESQQAIERERMVNEIAAQLTQKTDINEILQTAVREVGQALRSPQVTIRLNWDDLDADGSGSTR